jgi:hypothetical protein
MPYLFTILFKYYKKKYQFILFRLNYIPGYLYIDAMRFFNPCFQNIISKTFYFIICIIAINEIIINLDRNIFFFLPLP